MKTRHLTTHGCKLAASFVLCLIAHLATAQSIPEPGLVLYGQVRNTTAGGSLQTYGTLRWTIQPPSGAPINVFAPLTNINDQFSYVLRVPFETALAGFSISPNTLMLSNTPVTYTRTPAATPAASGFVTGAILPPALGSFSFGAADRGRSERVDLQVTLPIVDTDGDGMDDNWENAYFGNLSRNGPADFDGDGLSDFAEYKGGTNPNDANSRFVIFRVSKDPRGGALVEWSSSAATFYALQRSRNPTDGFQDIAVGIPGTNAPLTSWWDSTATGDGPYFYRARLDRIFFAATDSNFNSLPDDWERLYFGATGVIANADADDDGMSNLAEYKAGTNPNDKNSNLRFVNVSKTPQGVAVEWSSIYNKTYSILRSTNLTTGYAVFLSSLPATPPVNTYTNTSANAGSFFYRIRLEE